MGQAGAPTLADVRAAALRLRGQAVRTPLLSNPWLDDRLGARVLLKCECLQRTGSFKFRGAYNAIAALEPDVRRRGVVACSSGNHAQGVAEAARLFGIEATIVMPADAPAIKRMRTERSGGRVVAYDRATEDRDAIAASITARTSATFLHPYDDARIIAGQGTVGLEIVAEAEASGIRPDAVLVPCSGGGLSAGIGLAVAAAWPDCALHTVEPEGFDDYRRSLADGGIVANRRAAGSLCDALMATAPGRIGFGLNHGRFAAGLAVADADALAAVAVCFSELRMVVEPGGAVGLAALLAGALPARRRTVVIVLSGGNIDPAMLARALG